MCLRKEGSNGSSSTRSKKLIRGVTEPLMFGNNRGVTPFSCKMCPNLSERYDTKNCENVSWARFYSNSLMCLLYVVHIHLSSKVFTQPLYYPVGMMTFGYRCTLFLRIRELKFSFHFRCVVIDNPS